MFGGLVAEQRGGRLREVDVDPATGADGGAGEQRRGDGLERIDPGGDVGDGVTDPMRHLVVAQVDRDQSGKGLRHRIRARAF